MKKFLLGAIAVIGLARISASSLRNAGPSSNPGPESPKSASIAFDNWSQLNALYVSTPLNPTSEGCAAGPCSRSWLAFLLGWFPGLSSLKFEGTYQALLLDNGQVYYGKIDRVDSEFTVLTDVYYVQRQIGAQNKGARNILIRRGNEWHAPNRTAVSNRHISIMEPVTPDSQVAELMTALKSKDGAAK